MTQLNTLATCQTALNNKSISAQELTQHFLNQIKTDTHNCFISVCEDSALSAAKKADTAIAKGTNAPLIGLPIAHKDVLCTQNIKTSCGSKMLDNFIAPYDATIVEQCHKAGSILLGKTNMDEFAMGSSNENSFYGPVSNPWDNTKIPGGSSGGSAAAVASGLCLAATGTDTGGSIRQPAALCGITGLKPTYGRVSRYGLVAYASSFDQAGPMARTAEDCAILMNTMAGYDPKDSTSINTAVPDYTQDLNQSIAGLTIGLPKQFFAEGLDNDVAKIIETALDTLKSQGAHIKEIDLPHAKLALPTYYVLAPAECSANLARFDGVRYGYRCKNPKDLTDLYSRSRGEAFGSEVKRRIMIGTYVLSSGYYDAYYLKAQQCRRLIQQDFLTAFEDVDVIMGPTTPTTAFKLGEKTNDPVAMYLSDIYTLAVNLAGLPGLSVPAGFANNMPVGLQMIGPAFSETKLLNIGHQYQQHTDWHMRTPA